MEDYGIWLLLAAGELVFILLLLLLAMWQRQRAVLRRDRQAVRALVERARKQKIQRREQIRQFLSGRFGMAGDALAQAVHDVHRAEMRLIQTFATAYLNRNAAKAANFAVEVEASVEPYWELSAEAMVPTETPQAREPAEAEEPLAPEAAAAGETAAIDDGEVERLRGENNRLSEELRVTMDTMSRMLNEYSTIFSKDADLSEITVLEAEAEADRAAVEVPPADAEPETTAALQGQEQDGGLAAGGEQTAGAEPGAADEPLMPAEAAGTAEAGPDETDAAGADVPPESDGRGVADRAPPLDPQMRDLSADDESETEQAAADTEEAKRQRLIDDDS
jgi:hypothetical protein